MNGTNEPTSHLGNDYLHKRNSVMIEGGTYPRAKVMDQNIIDKCLMRGLINMAQHQAGEYLLREAQRGKVWATGANLSSTRTTGGKRDYVPSGAFAWGRTLSLVRQKFGYFHAYLVCMVVVHDWDITPNKFRIKILKQSLDHIAEKRMGGGYNALARLTNAARKLQAEAGRV